MRIVFIVLAGWLLVALAIAPWVGLILHGAAPPPELFNDSRIAGHDV